MLRVLLSVVVVVVTSLASSCSSSAATDCEPLYQREDGVADIQSAGLEICGAQAINRVADVVCGFDESRSCTATNADENGCLVDADCGGRERCVDDDGFCGCTPTCGSDDDCAADEACVCPGVDERNEHGIGRVPRCVQAACRTADDCDGAACGVERDPCGGATRLTCRQPFECVVDDDCLFGLVCLPQQEGGWACVTDDRTCD
ncbi:MAG TPA: hypothetical protein VGF99_21795 [Myxococcota bacterium]